MFKFYRTLRAGWPVMARPKLVRFYADPSKDKKFEKFAENVSRYFKRFLVAKLIIGGLALVGGSSLGTVAYIQWISSGDDSKIKEKFLSPISMTVEMDNYVPREEVERSLKDILTSYNFSRYWVISGEHGTGKTTAIQKVCRELGSGIIYVDVPETVANFKIAFADAIGVRYHQKGNDLFSKLHSLVYGEEKILESEQVNEKFKEYAAWYRMINRRNPTNEKVGEKKAVIVFDNINRLANEAPEILKILQESAKNAVVSNQYIAVFVTSDGSAPRQMLGMIYLITARSSISRARFYRIGDFTKEEAFAYLSKRKVPSAMLEKCYDLLGGRINHLSPFASDLVTRGSSFEEAQRNLMREIGSKIKASWLKIDEKHRSHCKKIISFAMEHESFDTEELVYNLFQNERVVEVEKSLDLLVKSNILSDNGDETFSVHSKAEKVYLANNMNKLLV